MRIPPAAQTDFYKTGHAPMFPAGTNKVYSNLTPRKSRLKGVDEVVWFGLQYFIIEYLMDQWNKDFFRNDIRQVYAKDNYPRDQFPAGIPQELARELKTPVMNRFKRLMDYTMGKDVVGMKQLSDLWDLGYMPLRIKSLPEGSLVPIRVACFTITNTVDHAFWLVNYLETMISLSTWGPTTSATVANEYKKLLTYWAMKTVGTADFVQWQGHDFSMRGMFGLEAAVLSGMGHLLSFTGTDTIPAICALEDYYGADIVTELVGGSVPATEHSVMCMGMKDGEFETFERLIDQYPTGILSIVSDTWDLWKVLTEYMPKLKDKIMARNGKIVIRPDSGDPVDIICGLNTKDEEFKNKWLDTTKGNHGEWEGVIELLYRVFGGTVNSKGYAELDPHVGAIYGDSITLDVAKTICERLAAKTFASTNIVFGIGSFTYQGAANKECIVTRDMFGFAVKATYGEVNREPREIFKDPITDDGTKKSAKGLLMITRENGQYVMHDQVTPEQEQTGELKTVFLDGELLIKQTLKQIRNCLYESNQLKHTRRGENLALS